MDNIDLLNSALSDLLIRSTEIRNEYTEESVTSEVETVGGLYEKLMTFRNGLDQLETFLNNAIRIKAKCDNMLLEARYAIEDAEVENITQKTNDYQSSRDRSIEINIATITERRASRRIEKLKNEAHAIVQVISNQHRGLEHAKRDTETRLRAVSYISPYEH